MPCWKLVRDRIGEELERRADGEKLLVLRVEGGELEKALRAKIVEEAMELAASGSIEEAGDLLEALTAWLKARGLKLEDALRVAEEKRRVRGGFERGYLVVWLDRDHC